MSAPASHLALPGAANTGSVRLYRGRTVEELLSKVQQELGAEAIVLRRREGLTGGIFGFFQRPFVELEATAGGPPVDAYDDDEQIAQLSAQVTEELQALAAGPAPQEPPPETPFAAELASAQQASPPPHAHTAAYAAAAGAVAAAESSVAPLTAGRTRAGIEKGLLSVGFSETFASELVDVAAAHLVGLTPGGSLAKATRTALALRIPMGLAPPVKGAAIAFVGPGGAGKTSCCAALIGAYRKGGALQASYASLLWGQGEEGLQILLAPHIRLPASAAAKKSLATFARARQEGVAILDTPAASPADRGGVRGLGRLLGEMAPEKVVLVVPATLGAVAAAQLMQALLPLKPNALAITHAEETDQLGVVVEAACLYGLAPEYVLDRARGGGWRVSRLDPAGLAERLMP